MTGKILDIAKQARRAGVAAGLRQLPSLSLANLSRLMQESPYAEDLGELTVAELRDGKQSCGRMRLCPRVGEPLDQTILRAFRADPKHRFSSSFFTTELSIPRWTAQKTLGALVDRGLLIRTGKTGSTRYRLAKDETPCGQDQAQLGR